MIDIKPGDRVPGCSDKFRWGAQEPTREEKERARNEAGSARRKSPEQQIKNRLGMSNFHVLTLLTQYTPAQVKEFGGVEKLRELKTHTDALLAAVEAE